MKCGIEAPFKPFLMNFHTSTDANFLKDIVYVLKNIYTLHKLHNFKLLKQNYFYIASTFKP